MKIRIAFFLLICICYFQKGNAQKDALETSGDVILFTLPAASLATTFIVGDNQGSWQFLKGFLLTEALTYGVKLSVYKSRPDNSDKNSFPSGHTSTTFQSASFIHKRYGFKYGLPAYALAGFTAFTRLDAKKHDGWDVLAGAIVGVGCTYIFTTPYQREHMELTFSSDNGDYMLGFTYKF